MQHNRRAGWSQEIILLIVLTVIGWASSAGMVWQHVSDIDRRLVRVEQKMDMLVERESQDHGKTR